VFWSNFSALCAEKGMSPNAVARELAIPSGSVTAWKAGSEPRNKTLVKIAEYFSVSVAFLLEGETDKKEKPDLIEEIGPKKAELLEAVADLTDAEQALLLEHIQRIKSLRG
jgi:transcriptional regulator with XRE-family HTH domain